MRRVLAFVLGMVACGGRVEAPGDAGEQNADGGGTSHASLPCPLLPPPAGDECSSPAGNVCKYEGGGLPCQAVECGSNGTWVSQGC